MARRHGIVDQSLEWDDGRLKGEGDCMGATSEKQGSAKDLETAEPAAEHALSEAIATFKMAKVAAAEAQKKALALGPRAGEARSNARDATALAREAAVRRRQAVIDAVADDLATAAAEVADAAEAAFDSALGDAKAKDAAVESARAALLRAEGERDDVDRAKAARKEAEVADQRWVEAVARSSPQSAYPVRSNADDLDDDDDGRRGGGWPSTTGNPSGGGRDNNPPGT
jgi:hypothetical protein